MSFRLKKLLRLKPQEASMVEPVPFCHTDTGTAHDIERDLLFTVEFKIPDD